MITLSMGHRAADEARARAVAPALPPDGDGLVIAGGDWTGRRPGWPDAAVAARIAAAALRGTPVAYLGIGSGPIIGRGRRRHARRLAAHADLLTVRDETTAASFAAAGVAMPLRLGADPVWAGAVPTAGRARSRAAETVLISGAAGDQPSYALGRLARVGRIVHDDRASTAARLVAACDYDGLVCALAAGVPCMAVTDEADVLALADTAGVITVSPTAGPGRADVAIDAALQAPPPDFGWIHRQQELARQSLELLRLVLAPGDGDGHDLPVLPLTPDPWEDA